MCVPLLHVCTVRRHVMECDVSLIFTGKTTLTEALQGSLGATRLYTPPPQITHLRAFFDALPEIVRRAYYSMGNYIVARDIIRECQSRPVIMDRFVHAIVLSPSMQKHKTLKKMKFDL